MATTDDSPRSPEAAEEQGTQPASRLPRLQATLLAASSEPEHLKQVLGLVTQRCRALEEELAGAQARNRELLGRLARQAADGVAEELRRQNDALRDQHQQDQDLVEKLQEELRETIREKARLHSELVRVANAVDRLAGPASQPMPGWEELSLVDKVCRLGERLAELTAARETAEARGRVREGEPARVRGVPAEARTTAGVQELARQVEILRRQLDESLKRNLELSRRLEQPGVETRPMPASVVLGAEARRLVGRLRAQGQRLEALRQGPHWTWTDAAQDQFGKVVGLVETGMRSMQGMRPDLEDQSAQCQSLSALVEMIEVEIGRLESQLVRDRQNMELVGALDQIFVEIGQGRHPPYSRLERLGRQIAEDVMDYPISALMQPYAPAVSGYLVSHSLNVARLGTYLALQSAAWRSRAKVAAVAALVHDVGMVQVPRDVYDHPGVLSAEHKALLYEHPRVSAWVTETIEGIGPEISLAVGQHHERLNGTGYPEHLAGEAVTDLARLLAVADSYESMISPRPHRLPKLPREAMGETLEAAQEGALDRTWVERFLNLSFYPVGSYVELSSGEAARVVAVSGMPSDPQYASRPVVQLLTDRHGRTVWTPEFLNLAHCPDRYIIRALARPGGVR